MEQTEIQTNSMQNDQSYIYTNDVLKLSPHVIHVGQKTSNDFYYDMHNHNFCEILFVKDGCGTTTIDGIVYKIKKGDIAIYNFREKHQEIVLENSMTLMFVTIGNLKLAGFEKDSLRNESDNPIIDSGESYQTIVDIFNKMVSETVEKRKFFQAIVQGYATELIIEVLRLTAYNPTIEIEDKPYLKAKEFIDNNYTKRITLDDICNSVFISKFYLSRSFKNNFGLSPIKYIIFKRIENAEKLLKETDYSVKKIATILGYEDELNFLKTFRKYNKISPKSYREHFRNKSIK